MTAVKRVRSLGLLVATTIPGWFHLTLVPSIGSMESNGLIARVLERFKVNPEEKLGKVQQKEGRMEC